MNKSLFLFWFCLFLSIKLNAQQKDSVYLKEVQVYGVPLSRYASGTKVDQLSSRDDNVQLNRALADETTAYFKTYGNSQLSTIAFRGTSASHTAIMWNGININSPTLGQTDFSLLPTFLLEDIAVQYGTASSLYGSDALGGSVILAQTVPRYAKTFKLQVHQQTGSFGRYLSGVKAAWGNEHIEFRTKAFYSTLANNFPYRTPGSDKIKRQNDASVTNYGVDQQVHYRISAQQQLSFEGMYTYNFRNIQPAITKNQAEGTLKDENTRLSLSYQNDLRLGRLNATAAYIGGNEIYNISSITKNDQLNLVVNMDSPIGSRTNLRYGFNAAKYFAKSDGYVGTVSEERYDGFISLRRQINLRWSASLNIRQSNYAHRYAPFSPSIGTEFKVINLEDNKLLFRSQASRGYRVPTLNDRYWTPGGNPSLKPEDALHIEGGLAWTRVFATRELKVDVTTFKTWTNQWIIWLPGSDGIWSPSNLQKVNAAGVEASIKYSFKTIVPIQFGLNYGYTRSINQKGLNELDQSTVNKQLPYVPVHLATGFVKANLNTWSGQIRGNYTSRRFITLDDDANQSLDPYALMDISLAKNLVLKSFLFQLRADINNVFNTYYESISNHAMPGRNYSLYLIIQFKN